MVFVTVENSACNGFSPVAGIFKANREFSHVIAGSFWTYNIAIDNGLYFYTGPHFTICGRSASIIQNAKPDYLFTKILQF